MSPGSYQPPPARAQVRNTVLPAWYNREGYINAMARLVAARIDAMQERDEPSPSPSPSPSP